MVTKAQRIVTYFNNSHRPRSTLKKIAMRMNVKEPSLSSTTKTRMTSVDMCCRSVLRNAGALVAVLTECPGLVSKKDVKDIILDRYFFLDLELLCNMLQPFCKVIMAVQGAYSSLSDVARYWLYLARTTEQQLLLDHWRTADHKGMFQLVKGCSHGV